MVSSGVALRSNRKNYFDLVGPTDFAPQTTSDHPEHQQDERKYPDDYPPEPIRRRPRRQRSLGGPTARPDQRAIPRGVLLARHAVGDPGKPGRQHDRRRPVTDPRSGRTTRTLPQRIYMPGTGNPARPPRRDRTPPRADRTEQRGAPKVPTQRDGHGPSPEHAPHRHAGLPHLCAWRNLLGHRHRRGAHAAG